MNTSTETAKLEVEYNQQRFAAGAPVDDIMAKLGEMAANVPQELVANNLVNDTLNPARVTYAKVAHEKGTKRGLGMIIFQLPSVEELATTAEGSEYMTRAIETALLRSVTVPWGGYLSKGRVTEYTLPVNVADFITEAESEGTGARRYGRAIWTAFAGPLCKVLLAKAKLSITPAELEKVLSNAAYAKQVFPRVPQSVWTEKIMPELMSRAPYSYKVKDRETGVERERVDDGLLFKHWLETRDSAELNTGEALENIDFGAE